jgi:hypothetical protein
VLRLHRDCRTDSQKQSGEDRSPCHRGATYPSHSLILPPNHEEAGTVNTGALKRKELLLNALTLEHP